MATNSAKSSMSIFSSWLAAPNSGVITYIGTSTSGTMAASPWPMPEVSTTIRSKPGHLAGRQHVGQGLADLAAEVARGQAAHEDTRAVVVGLAARHGPMAFMRMRSPSSAPPLLRRLGSMLMTAMRSASSWSRRRRRISSSVRLLLPAPPVPVMPSTGVFAPWRALRPARPSGRRPTWPFSSAVISWASARQAHRRGPACAARLFGACTDRSLSLQHHHLADHAGQAHALAVFGAVDARHAVGLQLAGSRPAR